MMSSYSISFQTMVLAGAVAGTVTAAATAVGAAGTLNGNFIFYQSQQYVHQGFQQVWYQGIVKATVFYRLQDLRFKQDLNVSPVLA